MNYCACGADEPEPVDPREQGSRAEHPLRAHNSPDNTGVVESCSAGACETLGLILRAELGNITDEEIESSNLDNRQPDNGE